jgi:TonB family protein
MTSDRARALELLQQGDAVGAATLLRVATKRDKNDVESWHWLGVVLERQGKLGDARKAHEKAARLGDALLMKQLESSISVEAVAGIGQQLKLASESTAAYLKLSPKLSGRKSEEWNERREFLGDYVSFIEAGGLQLGGFPIYKPKDVTTKLRVLSKPEPSYTEEARQNQVVGTVVLRAVFTGDGKVRGIIPVAGLPHGLTARAIRAARRIQFVPATKDGHPVSVVIELQYNFNLY